MSEKTELPTEKKLKDASEKGQTFKAKDLNNLLALFAATGWLAGMTDLSGLLVPLRKTMSNLAGANLVGLLGDLLTAAAGIVMPPLAISIGVASILSLLQSRFQLATEALVPSLERLDPIKGVGRLFSIRTVKELVITLAYSTAGIAGVTATLVWCAQDLFALVWLPPAGVHAAWQRLAVTPLFVTYACLLPICLVDAIIELRLHVRDLRMEKREVRQEHKDQEGDPEIRAKRRDLRAELLDEQTRSDVAGSRFIAANPTHIAVGIYVNESMVAWPFVSVRETNLRALAVIAYAESIGVPVIRNVRLARALYRGSRRYGFVDDSIVDEVGRILVWLSEVERATKDDLFVQADVSPET
ncbi:MAG: EscU/YscU/HrcU family type III secretion system export apparatus switch protein [Pararobbsia sp.]